jgi:hypothetical protein
MSTHFSNYSISWGRRQTAQHPLATDDDVVSPLGTVAIVDDISEYTNILKNMEHWFEIERNRNNIEAIPLRRLAKIQSKCVKYLTETIAWMEKCFLDVGQLKDKLLRFALKHKECMAKYDAEDTNELSLKELENKAQEAEKNEEEYCLNHSKPPVFIAQWMIKDSKILGFREYTSLENITERERYLIEIGTILRQTNQVHEIWNKYTQRPVRGPVRGPVTQRYRQGAFCGIVPKRLMETFSEDLKKLHSSILNRQLPAMFISGDDAT